MRKLLMLAAVAALSAACHSRAEDEVGAAPDEGQVDTTAVTHTIDSTRTGPPGVGGRPGDATVTPDSVGADTTAVQAGTDTMTVGQDTAVTSTPQDTLGPGDLETGADTTAVQGDTTGTWVDTTVTDTTSTNQY
jgi:hypothetical protein